MRKKEKEVWRGGMSRLPSPVGPQTSPNQEMASSSKLWEGRNSEKIKKEVGGGGGGEGGGGGSWLDTPSPAPIQILRVGLPLGVWVGLG